MFRKEFTLIHRDRGKASRFCWIVYCWGAFRIPITGQGFTLVCLAQNGTQGNDTKLNLQTKLSEIHNMLYWIETLHIPQTLTPYTRENITKESSPETTVGSKSDNCRSTLKFIHNWDLMPRNSWLPIGIQNLTKWGSISVPSSIKLNKVGFFAFSLSKIFFSSQTVNQEVVVK